MKKLLATTLALVLMLALAACSAEPITLAAKSVNGISVEVPSDFGDFSDNNGAMIASNEDKTASISVSAAADGGGFTSADIDQDTYAELSFPGKEVEFSAFDNAASINGTPAISAVCKMKNANGVDVTSYSFLLFHEDGTVQGVSVNYNNDVDSSAKDNADAIVKSIKAE